MNLDDALIAEIEAGIPSITVADACKRDDLDQKRLLGACLRSDFEDPMWAHPKQPTAEQLKDPGSLLILDNWQLRQYVFKHRPLPKS